MGKISRLSLLAVAECEGERMLPQALRRDCATPGAQQAAYGALLFRRFSSLPSARHKLAVLGPVSSRNMLRMGGQRHPHPLHFTYTYDVNKTRLYAYTHILSSYCQGLLTASIRAYPITRTRSRIPPSLEYGYDANPYPAPEHTL